MECRYCGKALPESAKRFCPWCGKELAPAEPPPVPAVAEPVSPPPPPTYQQAPPPPSGFQPLPPPVGQQAAPGQGLFSPEARQQAAAAAGEVKKVAGQVASGVQRALEDPNIREAIPGRSLSIAGLAIMATALLLSATPWFYGIGFTWSVIMLAGGALVAVMELRSAGVRVQGLEAIPASLLHPLLPPLFAGLAAIHAFLELSLGLVPLLWVVAAGLLVYDQYKKAMAAPDSVGHRFDLRQAWQGYRRYIVIGVAICLLSLFLTWSASAGHFSGGYESRYSSYYGGYVSDWNFTKYYWPGWDISGRSMSFVTFAVTALVALAGWAAFRGSRPAWFNQLGLGLGGVALLFWLYHVGGHAGVLLYLVGMLPIGFALAMLAQGQESGPYDLEHLLGKKR